jgi:DUF1680 family protein
LPAGSVTLQGPIDRKIRQLGGIWFEDQVLREMVEVFRKRANNFADGEFWGKAVRALCRMYDYTRQPELKAALDATVADLLSTQTSDGCISHRSEDLQPYECDLWGRKYSLWGLESSYEIAPKPAVLEAMIKLADRTLDQVGPPRKVSILDTGWYYQGMESSSILEPMLKLYRLTGLARYRDFARYIVEQGGCKRENIFEAAFAGKDVKDFTHNGNRLESLAKTYEMISNFEGLVEFHRVTGEPHWREAAEKFYQNVLDTEITVIGSGGGLGLHNWWGRAAGELWNYAAHEQACPMCEGLEGCTAARWLNFCYQLLRLTGEAKYADAMERTLYNAMLGAIKPDGQCVDYHTNLNGTRPGATGYGKEFHGRFITCCVYNIVDAMAAIPAMAVIREAAGPVVNFYIPGIAKVPLPDGNGVTLETVTEYPRTGTIGLRVTPKVPGRFPIRLRIPGWSAKTKLTVNGEAVATTPGSYAVLERAWLAGDAIELTLDLRCRLLKAPHGRWRLGNDYCALQRGPIVLARDKRLGDAIDEPVRIETTGDEYVALTPMVATIPCWMQFSVPTAENNSFPVVDYASAGATWDAASAYCTWMPTAKPPPMEVSWIGPDMQKAAKCAGEVATWIRGTVDIPASRGIRKATLMMAAEGRFTCKIDGAKVAETDRSLEIQVVDVTSHLNPGCHVLAVEAVLPADIRWSYGNRGGIIGALRIEYFGGAAATILTGKQWKYANQAEPGWEKATFDDKTWLEVETWPWKGTGIAPWNLFDRAMGNPDAGQ